MDNLNEIMAKDVFSSTPDTSLAEIAHLMVEHDSGEIPLVENSKVVAYSGKHTGGRRQLPCASTCRIIPIHLPKQIYIL
jgi:CBS domain-containing protein